MTDREISQQHPDAAGPPRPTPYELVFDAVRYEARTFPEIRTDAERSRVEPLLRDQFNLLASAGEAVREVIPEDAPVEAFEQYRSLLFHAFNFWRYGRRVYFVDPAVARYLVEAKPQLRGWDLVLPHPAVYVQLPPNLFWGSVSPDSTPEPIDGFFVTAADVRDAFDNPSRRLEILLVLGLRRNRAGFSVIPFDTETGPGIAAAWAESSGRDEGADFSSVLPGGEMAGLYSVLTVGEVLKLLGRVFWYLDSYPEDVHTEDAVDTGLVDGSHPVTRLSYHRMTLGQRPEGG